jgi:transposase
MNDGTGLAEAMLGLSGVRVVEVIESDVELVITVESTAIREFCRSCGTLAQAQDRMTVDVRDLPCFGRPARLVWVKRRWRCRESWCPAKTWTEQSEHLDSQAVITRRAGAEACRQVGENARPVSQVAAEFGVCWWTVMNAVIEHGTPLVDDPGRVGAVTQLGVDETSFLKATAEHATVYVTGLVDLEAHRLIDLVAGNSADDLRRWLANAHPGWLAGIEVVATDLAESYRAGLSPDLDHVRRVADPFHVVRVANRCVDTVRRRVQNETLGHRGRKKDPLFKIRKLLLTGSERLNQRGSERMLLGLRVGDPHDEVLGAWLAKESVRDIYLADTPADAVTLLDKGDCRLSRRRSSRDPQPRRNTRPLAHRDPRLPRHRRQQRTHRRFEPVRQEGQACGHGFRRFDHYRLRVLLHAGGITWPDRPRPPRIRTRRPHSNAWSH